MQQKLQTPARSALELCANVKLTPEARALLKDDLTPKAYFDLLIEHRQYSTAIRFLPHALTKRAAVWWGTLCLWHITRPVPAALTATALDAAIQWVLAPTEVNRRAAEAAGRAAGKNTAAGCLGLAAFWSGGSMARPDWPIVLPPPYLTAKMVGTSILFAAVQREPLKYRAHYLDFLALGQDVASGANRPIEKAKVEVPSWPLAVGEIPVLVSAET